MRTRRTWWLVPFAALSAGCSLVSDGVHVLSYRTHRALDDSREWHRDRKLAEAAWTESGARGQGYSEDFAAGFRDGFAEHLFRGAVEPPALAPARYRTVRSQTAAGFQAAEDWLNGFRAGTADAQRRGLRELVTGPSAFRTARPDAPPAEPVPLARAARLPPVQLAEGPKLAPAATKFMALAPPEVPRPAEFVPPPPTAPEPRGPSQLIVEREPEVTNAAYPPLPNRLTMQGVIQARVVVVTPPVIHSVDREPPPARDEPNWSVAPAPAPSEPGVVWMRSTERGGWAPIGERGRPSDQ